MILIFGGTTEGRAAVNVIEEAGKPYYYSTSTARYEQDFLLQIENKVVPVEVKISNNSNSPRLKAFHDKFHPEKCIRFSVLPFKDQGWMCNYPMYAVCNLS